MTGWWEQITLGQVAVWVGVIVGVVLAVWRGWPIFRKVIDFLSRGIKLVDTLTTLPGDLAFIKHELEANSGKSVKDIATRTELAVEELRGEVAHVKRQNAALKTSMSKTNRRLTEHIESSTN